MAWSTATFFHFQDNILKYTWSQERVDTQENGAFTNKLFKTMGVDTEIEQESWRQKYMQGQPRKGKKE